MWLTLRAIGYSNTNSAAAALQTDACIVVLYLARILDGKDDTQDEDDTDAAEIVCGWR